MKCLEIKDLPKAFTLAEVLITLAVIGIVAALTIPVLVQNADERATVTTLKKVYSTLSSAYKLAEQEYGSPDTWGATVSTSPQPLSYLAPYLKVEKDCLDGSQGCFPRNTMYYYLATSKGAYGIIDQTPRSKLRLSGNISIYVGGVYPNCNGSIGPTDALKNICADYYVDINGDKGPNIFGKDLFDFMLSKHGGIIPAGVPQQSGWYYFSNDCKDKDSTFGIGCAAWIIYNENMDYLHCKNLGWTSPTKCQ